MSEHQIVHDDPRACRVTARVLTPIESLTLPALDALYHNFEGKIPDEIEKELAQPGNAQLAAPDTAALARLTALGGQHASTVRQMSKYLGSGEVHDIKALRARNVRFLNRLQSMKQLARKYVEITANYDAGGKIYQFLELYTKLAKELRLESDSILSRIQRQVQTLRGQLTAVGDLTKEEILAAMKNLDQR